MRKKQLVVKKTSEILVVPPDKFFRHGWQKTKSMSFEKCQAINERFWKMHKSHLCASGCSGCSDMTKRVCCAETLAFRMNDRVKIKSYGTPYKRDGVWCCCGSSMSGTSCKQCLGSR